MYVMGGFPPVWMEAGGSGPSGGAALAPVTEE